VSHSVIGAALGDAITVQKITRVPVDQRGLCEKVAEKSYGELHGLGSVMSVTRRPIIVPENAKKTQQVPCAPMGEEEERDESDRTRIKGGTVKKLHKACQKDLMPANNEKIPVPRNGAAN